MQTQLRSQSLGRPIGHSCVRKLVVSVRAEKKAQSNAANVLKQISRHVQLPNLAKPSLLAAVTSMLATLPAHAVAGKIFDFNLTLPVMATQFLLLMVFLEKTWFTPVGKVLDERDRLLREKLGSVKDNSSELEAFQKEAEELIASARSEASKQIQDAKKASEAEIQAAVDENKKKLDKELEKALNTLENEQNAALEGVDSQVEKLVDNVLARVLPEGVKA